MHSRRKGKAGSNKPLQEEKPTWVRHKKDEVESLIQKLAKNRSSSQIGIILRDSYGIPDVKSITEKSISQTLKEKGLGKDLPDDLLALIKRAVLLNKHLEKNKKDEPAHRGLTLTRSKINRLVKYYKKTGRLPEEWKLQTEKISLYVE